MCLGENTLYKITFMIHYCGWNCRAPDKMLGMPGPKKFWMSWRMIQKRISLKTFLAKYDFGGPKWMPFQRLF